MFPTLREDEQDRVVDAIATGWAELATVRK
jgi:hypothetical protein